MSGAETRSREPARFAGAAWLVLATLSSAFMGAFLPALGEEGLLVHFAQRMLEGERLYRDLLTFTGPIPYQLLEWAFRVLGTDVWVARGLIAVGNGAAAWCVYSLARESGAGRYAHAVAGLWTLAPVLAFPLLSNYYYSTVALLLSVYATRAAWAGRERMGMLVLAGLLCAAVGLSKQTVAPALATGIALSLVLASAPGARILRAGVFSASTLGAVALGFAAFWWSGDLGSMWEATVLLPLRFEAGYNLPFPNLWPPGQLDPDVARQAIFYLPQIFYLAFERVLGFFPALLCQVVFALPFLALALTAIARARGPIGLALGLHTALLLSQISNLYPRTDWGHLVFSLPVALIHLTLLLARTSRARVLVHTGSQVALGGLALAAAGLAAVVLLRSSSAGPLGPRVTQRPVAEPKRYDNLARVIQFLREHTEPGDPIFVARAEPLLYFATDTRNPTPYPGVIPAMREEQERTITDALERTPFVVMSEIDQPLFNYYREVLPGVQRYLEQHYRIPQPFIRAGENWILVLERDRDRGPTLIDFFDLRAEGRPFTLDARGEAKPAELPGFKLPNQYNRRPLAVSVGPGGGGIEFDLVIPPGARLQLDCGRRPTRNLEEGYLTPPLETRCGAWIAVDGGELRPVTDPVRVTAQERQGYAWIPLEADLAEYAGQRVTLRFAFIGPDPEVDVAPATHGWFGSPRLAGGTSASAGPPAEHQEVDRVVGGRADREVPPVDAGQLSALPHGHAHHARREPEE